MVLLGNNEIRDDVFDKDLDEKLAPNLGDIVLKNAHEIYMISEKFFSITLITSNMVEILDNVKNVLLNDRGRKVILISALYGGGKTHTLLTLYHALKDPESLKSASPEDKNLRERVNEIASKLSEVSGSTNIIVIDGRTGQLAPSPADPLDVGPYKVKTLWGYIAHNLGNYDLLRSYDENETAPGHDKLIELFKNKRIVILIDEIANYILNLSKYEHYLNSLSAFFERLAEAVSSSKNVVLVFSLPVVLSKEGEITKTEIMYEGIRNYLEGIVKSLNRISFMHVEPVSPKNIPSLLRVRLFKKIDSRYAMEVQKTLTRKYKDYAEIFGKENISQRISETYPFHPAYIDILIDILDKNTKLQKTRDLLKITRQVLRSVTSSKESYELIMPWHIDILSNNDLQSYLLQGFEEFRSVIQSDIIPKIRNMDDSWIKEIIVTTLLLKTFVYGGGIPPKPEVYPTPEELAVIVYEPKSFSDKGYQPKDIKDNIAYIKRLAYVMEDQSTHRLWFTSFITPAKYIEDMAKQVDNIEVKKGIEEILNEILGNESKSSKGKRRDSEYISKIFSDKIAAYDCSLLDINERKYILYACIPSEPHKREDLLNAIIYQTTSGPRIYKNTVFVVFPSSIDNIRRIESDIMPKHIACNKIEDNIEELIEKLLSEYKGNDRDYLKQSFQNKAKAYCDDIRDDVYKKVLKAFDTIAYPAYEQGNNTIRERKISHQGSLVESVEKALKDDPPKIYDSIDFDTLNYYLKQISIDLTKSSQNNSVEYKKVKDVIEYFYSNPKLPAVTENAIKKAIAKGVGELEIGLLCGDKIYFKRIIECSSDNDCMQYTEAEGEEPSNISEECKILPWESAAREQLESLNSIREGTKIIEYLIKFDKELVPVEDVKRDFDKYKDGIKSAPLLKRIREVIISLQPDNYTVTVKPNETVEKEFYIERVGQFEGEVIVKSEKGEVDKDRIKFDSNTYTNKIVWRYKASEVGFDRDKIIISLPDGREVATAKIEITIKESSESTSINTGNLVREIDVNINEPNLKPLQILSTRLIGYKVEEGSVEVFAEDGEKISAQLSKSDLKTAFQLISNIVSLLLMKGPKTSISLKLTTDEPKPLPSFSDKELEELKPYIKIKYE